MLQTVQCPACSRKLAVDSEHIGTTVRCPICQKPFVADTVVPDDPAPEEITTAPPSDSAIQPEPETPAAPPASGGPAFAERIGVDLEETHQPAVTGKAEANRQLERWKEEMPEGDSAYKPSGRLPTGGVLTLGLGAVLGAPGGALAGLILGAITTALLFGIAWVIDWMAGACGKVFCIVVIAAIAVGLIGYGLTFAAIGGLAGLITTSLGMAGKNRNTLAAVLFSIASAIAGLVLFFFASGWIVSWFVGEQAAQGGGGNEWAEWVALAVQVLGSLLAVVVAAVVGRDIIRSNKFCEVCEEYMAEKPLPEVGLGGLKALTHALRERDLDAAADLLSAPEGKEGKPVLFHCERCGRGFLEVTAQFKATWKKGKEDEDKETSWLSASVELDEREMEPFRRHLGED
jgi:hypothetical protein